jgi:hypothetical protein
MYSIIFTAAIFIGVLINDFLQNRNKRMTRNFFLGIIATGLVTILWYLGYETVGWVMVLLPILILLISYITLVTGLSVTKKSPVGAPRASVATSAARAPPVESCKPNNPSGPYTAVAPPTSSTVSLPASIGPPPTPAGMPMTTDKPLISGKITPIVPGC